MLTGLLVPVAFRNKCERVTGPKPETFQSIFPGVNATRTSGTGLERDRNANRNRCEQGLSELGGGPFRWIIRMINIYYTIHKDN